MLAVVTSMLLSSVLNGSLDARAFAGAAIPLEEPVVGAETRTGLLQEAESAAWAYLPVSYRGPPPWPEVTIEPSRADMRVGETIAFAVRLQTGVEIEKLAVEISSTRRCFRS